MENLKDNLIIADKYTITRFSDNSFWIEQKDGEGMEVHENVLLKLIDKFYSENF